MNYSNTVMLYAVLVGIGVGLSTNAALGAAAVAFVYIMAPIKRG